MKDGEEFLSAALGLFSERGSDATSNEDLAAEISSEVAAIGPRHQLLTDLVTPFLDRLEVVVSSYPRHPRWPDQLELMLSDYLDVLVGDRQLVTWIDNDLAVRTHDVVGLRLNELQYRMRVAIRGDGRSSTSRVLASAALGMMWRPVTNLPEIDIEADSDALLAAVLDVARQARES